MVQIVYPSFNIETPIDKEAIYKAIERAGRTAYKSEDKITEGSAEKFIRSLIKRGHESVIEHGTISVRFIIDRGVSHELVRHRIASFTQESTRYCNYGKQDEITVIMPTEFMDKGATEFNDDYLDWYLGMEESEKRYLNRIRRGTAPQFARGNLPNSLKTEIVMTANIREWRCVLKLRTSKGAHPHIVYIMKQLLAKLQEELPALFDDIVPES